MKPSYVVRTLVDEKNGVVGINGWLYVLDSRGDTMCFDTKYHANTYLLDGGYTQEYIDENIEIINTDKREE